MGQRLTLRNPPAAQGHWYLHELLFLPQAAPEHRRLDLYDTHPERLGAQSFPQRARPALPQRLGQEALPQGPPLEATTAVQQRRRRMRTVPSRTARAAGWRRGPWPAGTSPGAPRDSGRTGRRAACGWRPWWRPSPWGP